MPKFSLLLGVSLALGLLVASPALADDETGTTQRVGRYANSWMLKQERYTSRRYVKDVHRVRHNRGVPVAAVDVPELDPGASRGAIVLLAGGLILLADRRRLAASRG